MVRCGVLARNATRWVPCLSPLCLLLVRCAVRVHVLRLLCLLLADGVDGEIERAEGCEASTEGVACDVDGEAEAAQRRHRGTQLGT